MRFSIRNISNVNLAMPGGVKLPPGHVRIVDVPEKIAKQFEKLGYAEIQRVIKKRAKKSHKTQPASSDAD